MKLNRWIFVPLVLALTQGIVYALFLPNWKLGFLGGFVFGAILGLVIQLWSEIRTKKLFDAEDEKDFSVKQQRKIILLQNINSAFDSCKSVILEMDKVKIKREIKPRFIKAKSNMNLHSFGTEIKIDFLQINENMTEVVIFTSPALKTTVVDYGESLRIIEELSLQIKENDSQVNQQILIESVDLLNEIYVKPFEKEKVKVNISNK